MNSVWISSRSNGAQVLPVLRLVLLKWRCGYQNLSCSGGTNVVADSSSVSAADLLRAAAIRRPTFLRVRSGASVRLRLLRWFGDACRFGDCVVF